MAMRKSKKRQPGRQDEPHFIEAALACGAAAAKVIDPVTVETAEWVRWKCQFGCDGYGTSLVCPPHSPTPGQTRILLDGYRTAVLFEAGRGEPKKIALALEKQLFLEGHYKAFGLGAGPCSLCATCALSEGCRHAEDARPAMEACGIDVFATARKHGFTINVVRTHKDPQHYFGLVLIE
jgi:predicted metal-binding protein